MRILVLATKPLDMKSGDALRFVNVARHLLARHAFELLCFAKPGQDLDVESAAVFQHVVRIPYPEEKRPWIGARAFSVLSPDHCMPSSDAMRVETERALARNEGGVVLDLGGLMLENLPEKLSLPVVADSIDEPRVTYLRALRHARWSEKPRALRMLWMFERVNREISERADANVYASDVDAASYARFHPESRVEAIPNGVDADYFQPAASPPDPERIAFEGNLAFGPNVDTALALAKTILPLLWKTHPGLMLDLIGREPASEVRALANERIRVTGTVADVREHLSRARVFVCPMRLGAGVKNKILQAWALGMPIVASSEAMGGLDARDGENVLLRDEPEAFAAAVSQVLSTPELARKLSVNGRRIALEKYSWKTQAERFEQLFEELARNARRLA